MLYVSVDSPAHRDQLQYSLVQDFVTWICKTYPGSEMILRRHQEMRVYWHEQTKTVIVVRGLM